MMIVQVQWLGRVNYAQAWDYQKLLVAERAQHQRPDTLLLLEHPHTYTLGSAGKIDHLLMPEAERAKHGVTVLHVDRGGDITYHGPGQLVAYPIFELPTNQSSDSVRADVVAYIRQLEQVIINTLAVFDIRGVLYPPYTGVWVDVAGVLHKIAAIGVKVNVRRVAYHGFALNVAPDMSFFKGIIPCGIDDKPVVSMEYILGYTPDMHAIINATLDGFSAVFNVDPQPHQVTLT